MSGDLMFSVGLLAMSAVVALLYLGRLAVRGRVSHERVDADGGSILLGKPVMEMGYWLMKPVLRACRALRITPNMVTTFSLVLAVAAGVALAGGRFGLGCVIGTLAGLCDMLDGILARELRVASEAGEVLDASADRYAEFFFLGGIIFYYRKEPVLLLLALCALFGSFMVSYGTARAEAAGVQPPRGSMRRAERVLYLLAGAALTPLWAALPFSASPKLLRELPIVAAVALVALVSNVSVVRRVTIIYRALRARDEYNSSRAGKSPTAVHAEAESPKLVPAAPSERQRQVI